MSSESTQHLNDETYQRLLHDEGIDDETEHRDITTRTLDHGSRFYADGTDSLNDAEPAHCLQLNVLRRSSEGIDAESSLSQLPTTPRPDVRLKEMVRKVSC